MEYPGAIYHLTVRANGGAELFEDDDDRRYLLGRIAVAARMLCQYGGLTPRAAAPLLGVRTGEAVCCQLRKLTQLCQTDAVLHRALAGIEKRLDRQHRQQA